MTSPILVTREDDVVIIALNKPEKLNAMDLPMWQGLGEAFAQVNDDESVRCVILKGEGGKAFAAGADIKEFDTVRATAAQAKDYDLVMRRALADIRICGEGSRFGVPINRISVVMAHPEIQGLLRHANPAHVLEILLEGKIVGAADAFRMGLVNRVVEDDMVSEEVIATVRRITAGAPLVNRWHKAFVRRLSSDPSPLTAEEMDRAYDFLATSDYKEGIAAFTAKRKPAFSGT
jgi:enoyl-CoA hydratase/carnithine racemase